MTQSSTKPLISKPDKRRGHPQTNPRSLANLRHGNPPVDTGKHGYSLKSRLIDALMRSPDQPLTPETVGDQIVLATIRGAIDLVPVALRETWDRVEGSVTQQQQAGTNLQVNIVVSPAGQELLMRLRAQGGKPALKEGRSNDS